MQSYATYLDWISDQEEKLLLKLKQWVAINTFSNLEGLSEMIHALANDFKILKGKQQMIPLSPLSF